MNEIREEDQEAQRQMPYQEYWQAAANIGQGIFSGSTPCDAAKVSREYRVTTAIYALTEAKRVRADEILMAEIRAWVREKRDDLAGLLDDMAADMAKAKKPASRTTSETQR